MSMVCMSLIIAEELHGLVESFVDGGGGVASALDSSTGVTVFELSSLLYTAGDLHFLEDELVVLSFCSVREPVFVLLAPEVSSLSNGSSNRFIGIMDSSEEPRESGGRLCVAVGCRFGRDLGD